jgi:hypothetical protein
MSETAASKTQYSSFDEFARKFCPNWYEDQQAKGEQKSFGHDLARYSVDKHFPPPPETSSARSEIINLA